MNEQLRQVKELIEKDTTSRADVEDSVDFAKKILVCYQKLDSLYGCIDNTYLGAMTNFQDTGTDFKELIKAIEGYISDWESLLRD